MIGVALDASQGRVWFAKNGVWLNGGQPEEDLNPAVQLSDDFEYVLPVIGILPGCTQQVQMRARFGPDFHHERPATFIPIRSDECSCTAGFVACMSRLGTRPNCLSASVRATRCGRAVFLHTLLALRCPVRC